MSTKGGPVFTFILPGGVSRSLAPRQLCHWLSIQLHHLLHYFVVLGRP